ncbi:ATP-binding cassette domain-containing protein [Lachnospiraceae bacterium MD1]|jgi:sodium transport system ATP-binding protein|uniref:ATP-binding cassette domain-containing protein n=1 Tax=Variimorphobacter saccharofermentans TaxID=2755051 RepID=A0A839K3Q3_9FIRM|nr:ATP-binding cassette domain-containing protein [Variimorphobacter saccharofermentans]MBB2184535.1 ATP-binding cassette domain-containing protein [Variimorphobacter saccharofermentans]
MIIVKDLTKIYKLTKKQMQEQKTKKNMKVAVKQLSLNAEPGQIYGLLGPNGAGKTTALRCIATLLKPTDGSISVCGYDTVKESEKVRKSIGFLTNEIKLDPQFSPKYMFQFFGRLHGLDEETINKRREELFEYFGITDFQDKKIDELSTGMKQKASIAVSLVHDPEVVIFDEPTNGLDIVTARNVTDYLKLLKEKGKTIIISTHIMSEAEKLCDKIGIIISGEKVMEGSLNEILTDTYTKELEDAFFELYKKHSKEEA